MATHSSILALRSAWTGKPGGLPSIGLQSQTQLKQLNMQAYSNADLDKLAWYVPSKFTIIIFFFNESAAGDISTGLNDTFILRE